MAQQGRIKEAKTVIQTIARRNKVPVPDLSVLKNRSALMLGEEGSCEKEKDVFTKNKKRKYSFIDLFRTKKMMATTLAVTTLW